MKRHYTLTLGERELKLSLSFKTSLAIMDEVASPTKIIESVLRGYAAEKAGERYESEFQFNERNSVRIVELANAEYQGLSFDEIGELAMANNFLNFYGEVLAYLNELVMGRSEEVDKTATGGAAGNPDGQSS